MATEAVQNWLGTLNTKDLKIGCANPGLSLLCSAIKSVSANAHHTHPVPPPQSPLNQDFSALCFKHINIFLKTLPAKGSFHSN